MKKTLVTFCGLLLHSMIIAQRVGINTTDPQAMLHVKDSNVVFSGAGIPIGDDPNPPISGPGHRMMWFPARAAFRVGNAGIKNWDRDSIGLFSFAAGDNPRAKGAASIAMGKDVKALGVGSVAMGLNNTAGEDFSTAIGLGNIASGNSSIALGSGTTASGYNSTTMGLGTVASGSYSTATGHATFANGDYSTAIGFYNQSSGYASLVTGIHNDPIVSPQTTISSTTPLFIVGNGNSLVNRSNAMVVLKNGNVGIGTNYPANKLHIDGGSDASYTSGSGYMLLGSTTGVNIVFDNNEIMARNNGIASTLFLQASGGSVLIGTSNIPSTANTLDVSGTAGKTGGGSWAGLSDARLKQEVRPYTDGLKTLLKINPVWFRYNEQSGYNTKQKFVGVLAQELQQVSSYMVSSSSKKLKDGTPGYLQVDNSAMTYMLINAVKEQQQQIEELKKANEQLTILVQELLKK